MLRHLFAAAAMTGFMTVSAQAANFSYTGNFTYDNDVALFSFTVSTPSTVTLKTYSYAGGTMADGTVISAGGFDPILSLFDATGLLIDSNDDGSSPDVNTDPVTGSEYDTFLMTPLGAGSYTVAVTQFDNTSNGSLGSGFLYDGPGNEMFTSLASGCGAGIFCDVNSDDRTSFWAFDILNVDVATGPGTPAVPLPASLPLLLVGMGGLAALRRKRG